MSKTKKRKRDVNITVLGAGSWGTTLALLLNEKGYTVKLWEYFPEFADKIKKDKENKRFLPGMRIPSSLSVTSDIDEALIGSSYLIFVTPSHTMRKVARSVSRSVNFNGRSIVVNASKGLEEKTLCRMSEVLSQEIPVPAARIAGLLGPSHAEEVSRKMPTSIVVAGSGKKVLSAVQDIFMTEYFRVYTNSDLIGVELGVSLKNTIAIAAGICDGLGFGDNTKAALLTRGLAETKRLACRLGAKDDTLSGLAGVGDMIVTCMSRHSRNRFVGEQIGKGKKLKEILENMVMVAEGVKTTKAALKLSSRVGVELPITEQVYKVLFNRKNPRKAIRDLMVRKARSEMYR
ncbi:MAG: NAD(P)H-dependent glycerol-3-phosphate dehydrogenase [Candidatus Krumholzibacteriota bacterium]|nr:NAD(P)H-dependent glycerol-3-phosphate dehydrogenase [Candidatus Krumholzibacteriota bacterium]